MSPKKIISLGMSILILTACKSVTTEMGTIPGYRLHSPDALIMLPAILYEISGITFVDSSSVACIQDEMGIIYIYDVNKKEIKESYNFFLKGDFEGIARVENTYYVLRSDGSIYEVSGFYSEKPSVKSYITGITSKDNEGLCYDSKNNRLLLAPKSSPGKGSGSKNKWPVYGFDLKNREMAEVSAMEIDLKKTLDFLVNKKIDLPLKTKKKSGKSEPDLKFEPSCIALHPVTGSLYLISASDNLLFVFNSDGSINDAVKLDISMFNQPEGITFMQNGDMLISNEGKGRNPTLLRFNYSN